MKPQFVPGELLRWYVMQARHPFKNYLVGHYWHWFERPRVWVQYDEQLGINVCLRDYVQQEIFLHGYYERPMTEWLKRTLRPDDIFWDVGANIGAISLIAATRCAHVVAFEPDPRSLKLLRENIRFNGLANIEIVPCALGATQSSVTLHQAKVSNTGMTSILPDWAAAVGQVQVPVQRADEFLAEHPDLTPTILKLDVEGAEHLVLQGAPELLRTGRVRAILFEDRMDANGQPGNLAAQDCLRAAGYTYQLFGASDEHVHDEMRNFLATPEPTP